MQPLYEVTLTRPWHWGIAIVSAIGAELPESASAKVVTPSSYALIIKVRHAQDIDADGFEGEWDWATATLRVRSLTDFEVGDLPLYEGVLHLPGGRLTIGDADSDVTINGLDEITRVRVSVTAEYAANATDVLIDLAPSL